MLTMLESKDGLKLIHLILVCSERQYIFNVLSFEILNYKPDITPMGYCLEITAKENPLPQHSFSYSRTFYARMSDGETKHISTFTLARLDAD